MLHRYGTPLFGRSACALAALAGALLSARPAAAAKIACVGDSITFGYNLSDPSTQSYPAVLGMRLGAGDTVQNFGVSGATLLKSGDKPYWNEANFSASTSFAPDVVVVMLGTNDAKPQNWSNKAEFAPDYLDLIAHYRSLGALVYVATPPPVYPPGAYDISPDVVANEVVPLVTTVAGQANAPLIDVFSALSDKSQDFPDTVHPNAAGAALIADAVQASLGMNGLGGASMTGAAGGAGRAGVTGGAGGTGGVAAASGSGGAPSGGGVNASGGVRNAGGASGAVSSSGGSPGASGATMSSMGGALAANGGAVAAGTGGTGTSFSGSAGMASTRGGAAGAPAAGAGSESSAAKSGSGGCGCRASPSGAPAGVPAALALVFVALRRRRRRAA